MGALRLAGAQLRAPGPEGADLTGALLRGVTTDGGRVRLRIDGVNPDGALVLYQVSSQIAEGSAWAPLCEHGAAALPLPGRWDYGSSAPGAGGPHATGGPEMTLACEGSALVKCLRLGYRPWRGAGTGTRLLRASGEVSPEPLLVRAYLARRCPERLARTPEACATARGALLFTEAPPG